MNPIQHNPYAHVMPPEAIDPVEALKRSMKKTQRREAAAHANEEKHEIDMTREFDEALLKAGENAWSDNWSEIDIDPTLSANIDTPEEIPETAIVKN